MLEKITKQTLTISIILVLLASAILVSILSINTKVSAEEYEGFEITDEDDYEIYFAAKANTTYHITEGNKMMVADCTDASSREGLTFIIESTANEFELYGSSDMFSMNAPVLRNSKIIIEPRTTELNIYFFGVSMSAPEQEACIYNKSTEGRVNLVSFGMTFLYGNKTSDGSYKDGYDVYGTIASRGDLGFLGYAFYVQGANANYTTKLGNLSYGGTGIQVFGKKTVYIEGLVLCAGGQGATGDKIGKLGLSGGHGGYAYDGALSNIEFADGQEAMLRLEPGAGGKGASVPKGGIVGKGGKAGGAYYLSLKTNNSDKVQESTAPDGQAGSILE